MSNLETHIRRIRQETLEDIQHLEKSIARCEENIQRVKAIKTYNPKVLVDRNKTELEKFQQDLEKAQQKLEQIEQGTFESVFRKELEQNKKMIQEKTKATQRRKLEEKNKMKPVQKSQPNQPVNSNSTSLGGNSGRGGHRYSNNQNQYHNPSSNYNERRLEREMDQAERYYLKDCASIPDHLREKLKNMPSNMGYIWKDIWCFGDLSPNSRHPHELTLFEKKGHQFLVHTYAENYYSLHEKDNSGKRKLLSRREVHRFR